jgi:hypothetical protein
MTMTEALVLFAAGSSAGIMVGYLFGTERAMRVFERKIRRRKFGRG